LAAVVAGGYFGWTYSDLWLAKTQASVLPLTATVQRTTLPIIVSAGGELASADAVQVVCELEGQDHKIIEMLPEGTRVEADQVVIRLDTSAINDRLAEKQIAVTQAEAVAIAAAEQLKIEKNLAESLIAQSKLTLTLAELDREKYEQGEYLVELSDLQGAIALARADLQDAQDEMEHFQDLVKKGFRTPEQLRSKEQSVKRFEYELNKNEERLRVLDTYTRKRQLVELKAKALEAEREQQRAESSAAAAIVKAETDLQVARATADLERQQLERIRQQLDLCEIRAPTAGVLVYAKEKNKQIEAGGTIYYKQKLFSIPSSDQMKVDAYVHEAQIKKVQPGSKAEIRVDAFPNLVLDGTIREVASYYNSTRHWLSGGVKEYATVVSIDEAFRAKLRSGMTAEVRIFADTIEDQLVVPIAAVAEKDGDHHCFVVSDTDVRLAPVTIGANTSDYVVIEEGLSEGDEVALDARQRINAVEEGESVDDRESVEDGAVADEVQT
jgi:RND family efflux transporter MFP subunit